LDNPDQILRELDNIKILLIFIGVCLVVISWIFIVLVVSIRSATKGARLKSEVLATQQELEDLLSTGQGHAAKAAALSWVASQPKRKEAHWALAKAHHQLGELSEAKAVLNGLLEFAPDEHFHVTPWLELLDSEFAKKRPTRVE
jgi:uncharacterized membrane protein YcjF (UPF0283 family)